MGCVCVRQTHRRCAAWGGRSTNGGVLAGLETIHLVALVLNGGLAAHVQLLGGNRSGEWICCARLQVADGAMQELNLLVRLCELSEVC